MFLFKVSMTFFRKKKSLNWSWRSLFFSDLILMLKITYFQWSVLDLEDHLFSVIWSWSWKSLISSDVILIFKIMKYGDLAHLWVQVSLLVAPGRCGTVRCTALLGSTTRAQEKKNGKKYFRFIAIAINDDTCCWTAQRGATNCIAPALNLNLWLHLLGPTNGATCAGQVTIEDDLQDQLLKISDLQDQSLKISDLQDQNQIIENKWYSRLKSDHWK